ncbi:hypothetical protein EVAR_85162_1 [Eumeta japonica]|uniref:MADF domain-containing protein n=1 Tax=Eumeta variegata TaxID=151549 RepID=A0A4C1ZWZ3_EUMVA|nr:hypothetical protein EVAR_85162_1 [Eumeta japonica]
MMVHRSGPPYRGRSGVGWLVVRTMVAEWPRYRFFVHTSKVVGQRWRYPSTRRPLLSLRSNAVESRRAEYLVSDAWNRISNNMGIPVDDLKKKKETLMTAFRTNLKRKRVYEASTSLDDEDSSMSQNGNLENENPNATVNSEINIPVVRRRSRNPPELQEASNEMKGPFHL